MRKIEINGVAVARNYFRFMKSLKVVLKGVMWLGVGAGVLTALFLLWMWASSHLLSFLLVIGAVCIPFGIIGWCKLHLWSAKKLMIANYEEKLAQYREKHGEGAHPISFDSISGRYYGSKETYDANRYRWSTPPVAKRSY